ncbi:hypothetical protein PIB30_053608 [Stylosanthes scabra]|uniref:Transposase MuDR plant domain-containing protein n=1 Tax=Stylosanthes scabra TaxID=79078 RepID=A0ABU6QIA6_9FABA|nr:hypothetical protein [Stylosanthes scabra]
MAHASMIELYVEFEQIPYGVGAAEEAQPELTFDGYYSDSEEEFEDNYEMDDANEEDVLEHDTESEVEDVANALANELPFQEPSFMRPTYVPGGEFVIEMEFNSRESVIKAVKKHTISRGVDYWVRESEPTHFMLDVYNMRRIVHG